MLGLIFKDIYEIKKQIRIYAMIMLVYVFFSVMSNNLSFLSFIALFANLGIVFSALAYDEKCNWEKYCRVLPVSYQNMILVRYIEIAVINTALFVILLPVSIFMKDTNDNFLMVVSIMAATLSAGMIIMAILLPIIYKLGVEKARIIMFVIVFIPVIIITLFAKLNVNFSSKLLNSQLADFIIKHLYIVCPVIALIMLCISFLISIAVVGKKEY